MTKLVIFDLDGVLVDSRELHYISLNDAIREVVGEQFIISREEHLSMYDGLPTTKKLEKLTLHKGLPRELYSQIWLKKQYYTLELMNAYTEDNDKIEIFKYISSLDIKIAVCSNSIRKTVQKVLHKKGLLQYIDYFYSNEDVKKPKPSSEMYLKAMIDCGVDASDTVIIEDSHIGRIAALNSGAKLIPVRNPSEVTLDLIQSYILYGKTKHVPKWKGGNLTVVIPMAGDGKSFENAGFTFPKSLIDINGKTMIQLVMENLNIEANYIFITKYEDYSKYHLDKYLSLLAPNCNIFFSKESDLPDAFEGAAITLSKFSKYIDTDSPLLIANADQYLDWNSNEFMYSMLGDTIDGGIATFASSHPKWSFVKVDSNGFVNEVAEKIPISDIATCGIYYWAKGSEFIKYLNSMIDKNITTNGEFYIAPVYNEAIADGKKIKIFPVKKMWGLGTPEDVEVFKRERESYEY